MKLHSARALAALCLSVTPLHAALAQQSAVTRLDDIVVTPGRVAQSETEALGDVTVIRRAELERAEQDSLLDLLARQPGVGIYGSGGPQTAGGLFLRGANANQTLVLMDGLRINGSTSGGVNWNTLDPALIERIEIVRGAASSLYGSDAIGGVVNIITRRTGEDRPLRLYGQVGYGSYETFKSSVGLSGAQSGWDYALSGSVSSSGGYSTTNSLARFGSHHPDNDGYRQQGFSGSLGYMWRPGQHLGVTVYNNYINGDYDNGLASHPAYAITRQQAYALTSTNRLTSYWDSVLRLGLTDEMGHDRNPGYSSMFGSRQRSYLWQNNLQLAKGHQLSVVLERLEEEAQGDNTYTDTRRHTNSAGLVYRGNMGPHHVQASLRHDNVSNVGGQTTGGLTYEYDITSQWRVSLGGSTGFKAPTFNDLYAPAFWGANPDLRPEKSRNIEAGLHYTSDMLELGVVAYHNKVQDLIVSDPSTINNTLENLNSATLKGITLSGAVHWKQTTLSASADFSSPRNDDTGKWLNRRARQTYRLAAEQHIQQWRLGAEYLFVGATYDDNANLDRLGGYGLVNLTASYALTSRLNVQARWNNVFGKRYANAYGYNMQGSNVFVSLAWQY